MNKAFARPTWGILAALLAAGCARYEAMPLTRPAVDRALTPPANAVLADVTEGLTPDSAAVLAVTINPALRVERDRRSLAEAQLLQAKLLPNPTLDFSYDPVTGGNTLGAVNAYSVGVSWEVTALITHNAKIAAAGAKSRSVVLDVAWQEWQFAQAAKKAVYDLLALQAQLHETELVDQQLAKAADLVRKAVNTHDKTLLDLAAAEAAAQKAHEDFLGVRRDFHRQQLALNQALGVAPETSVRLANNQPLPSVLHLPPAAQMLSEVDQRRLDLLALRQGYESQEQTLRAAVLAQFPKIVLGVHQASDNTGVQSTGFGITVDLPIFDRNQAVIATEKATRQQLFDEYISRVYEARSIVTQTMADIAALADQIAAAQAAIPKLERLVKVYETSLGQHNVDILSYYTAQSDLSQQRLDLLKLQQQMADNQIALEIASGRSFAQPTATAPTSMPSTLEARE
jgi:outer membrane protein TolC